MAIKVLVLVGGISKNSLNKKLFSAFKELAAPGMELQFQEISNLPFFSQDLENDPPAAVQDFQKNVDSAQGILFITPEYNRSIPGVLKNAIDWCSRPYGKNRWAKKPTGIAGASMGAIGTFGAQQHLRNILSYLDMHVMHQPEFYLNASKSFDDQGKLQDEGQKKFFKSYLDSLEKWCQSHL